MDEESIPMMKFEKGKLSIGILIRRALRILGIAFSLRRRVWYWAYGPRRHR